MSKLVETQCCTGEEPLQHNVGVSSCLMLLPGPLLNQPPIYPHPHAHPSEMPRPLPPAFRQLPPLPRR